MPPRSPRRCGYSRPAVPTLDFAVIADYVRSDGGVAHVLGGGFDTIHAPSVPVGRNIGIWARVLVARTECDREHDFEVIVQTEDGERVAEVAASFATEWPEGHPVAWPVGMGIALNLGVPLPRFGLYGVEILVNDNQLKSIPLRVIEQAPPEVA